MTSSSPFTFDGNRNGKGPKDPVKHAGRANQRRTKGSRKAFWRDGRFWGESVIAALVIGTILVSFEIYFQQRSDDLQRSLDDRRTKAAQELEEQRNANQQRLENVRFVRGLSSDRVVSRPFAGLDLRGQSLRALNLRGASFFQADLRDTDLTAVDLRNAWLEGADLRGANLLRADLRGAFLRNVKVDASTNLDLADIRGASHVVELLGKADAYEIDTPTGQFMSGKQSPDELSGLVLCIDERLQTRLQAFPGSVARMFCASNEQVISPTIYPGETEPRWQYAPTKPPAPFYDWAEIAEITKAQPRRWVIVRGARGRAVAVRRGWIPQLTNGTWDTRIVGSDLYIRYWS